MFSGFCVDRLLICATLTAAIASAQEVPTTRQVDLALTEGTSMAAAASPDGRSIAIDLLGGIWVLPMRGGDAKRITPELLEARQPTWSPDGHSIAFQGYGDDGAWHIFVIPREGGEAKAITHGVFDDREPAWSHDGSRIAFSSDRFGGIYTIWDVTLATGDTRRVSTRDGVMPTWSPNDQEITFASRDRESGSPIDRRNDTPGLWAVSAGGGERLIWDAKDKGMPAGSAWNPEGTQVAYTTATGHLGLSGRAMSSATEDVFPFRPSWVSPTAFIYTADGHIKRRSLTGDTSIIPFTAKVSLLRSTYTIAHRELEPKDPQTVTGIVNPVVSPNGQAIAFTAMGDLWILPQAGQPTAITNDPATDIDPAWSPDSTRLAFASDRGGRMDLWVHDFRTNADAQLTEEHGAVSGPAWSPDGNHIAYLVDHRRLATITLQRDQHNFNFVSTWSSELGRPTWSGDSSSIAVGALLPYSDRYREGLNQILLFSSSTSGASSSAIYLEHSAGNRQDTGPVWSPDGFHMAFVTEGTLWVVPVNERGGATGPPESVATDQPESPSWEGDSKHIVYQTPKGLRRILTDGSPPEPIPLDLTWRNGATPGRIVVHAGHVLDGVLEAMRGESDIVIESGVIRSIEGHRDDLHVGAVVDASNEFVMPGLVDMHAHLDDGYGQNFGSVWLAYGVTSLRIPSINPYAGLEQREAFDAGRRPGPRVFVAGDPFDGARMYYPGGVAITSAQQLAQELDRASTLGVDFFKTYVRLPDRFQKGVVDFAHALNKPVTSHEIYPAIAFGIDGVEHLSSTSRRGYSPKLSATRRAYKDVIDLLTKSGVTLTPTIGIYGAFNARATGDRTLLFDARIALYPLSLVSQLTDMATARADSALDQTIKQYEVTLKAVSAGGGKIIAGTDSPIVPYGLGLQVEIESYVHAGLTPFQALQTATVNAAQALGIDNQIGTIEPGKLADLTFLGSDPLVDIRNARDVKRVMRGGRLFSISDLITR